MRTHDMNKLVYDLYFRNEVVSGYANRYSYGSKAVTQPDASPKRYLWDKKSLDKSFTKHSDRCQF